MESGYRSAEQEPGQSAVQAIHAGSISLGGGLSRDQLVTLAQALRELGGAAPELVPSGAREDSSFSGGRARKISVSMPEDLSAAVQQRVGRGEFSKYVTEAVAQRLESDLLAELVGLLDEEHGEVPEDLVAEAEGAWPDVE